MRRFRLPTFVASVSASLLVSACSAHDVVMPTLEAPGMGGVDAGAVDGGSGDDGGSSGTASADCNMKGVWAVRGVTVTQALNVPQYANSWYYLEINQPDGSVDWTITKQFDCGIEVRGSVIVTLPPSTLEAHMKHNSQVGRKGTMKKNAAGRCDFTSERFWVLLGAADRFLPPRNTISEIEPIAARLPLPTIMRPDGAEDWDGDGKLGLLWQVSGVLQGARSTVQRQWFEWFSNDKHPIEPAQDWTEIVVSADFDKDESIFDPTEGLLVSPSYSVRTPETPNRVGLRFLGRSAGDPRGASIVRGTDPFGDTAATIATCHAMQEVMAPEDM